MPAPFNPNMTATFAPPVMEARRWIEGLNFPEARPLINVSQAAPVEPPPPEMRDAMAEIVRNTPQAHLYGAVLGLPALRAALADRFAREYGGAITSENVAITAGCNEAFTAAIATLAAPGDEVILPTPWYFNHKMALDMGGQTAVPLATGPDLIPEPDAAARLITPKTRAIVLVTPNNPGGAEYPPGTMRAFRDLARARGLALIVDETYRDFHSQPGAPHDLFADPGWDDTLIQLYSFSKAYRLTGHRVGALIAGPARLREVEKYLDTVTICPPQLGQHAALWGLKNLSDWLAAERLEILARREAITRAIGGLAGWQIIGSGAYFAYCTHPFDAPSDVLARRLVTEAGILALPGTMFMPAGDAAGARQMRIAFANLDVPGIEVLAARLAELGG
ncbi:MAG: aminotransferase [Rhodobacteraceae bacterium]|nr:aminotransferase [Paracoccaceae bacterium]